MCRLADALTLAHPLRCLLGTGVATLAQAIHSRVFSQAGSPYNQAPGLRYAPALVLAFIHPSAWKRRYRRWHNGSPTTSVLELDCQTFGGSASSCWVTS